MEYNCQLRGTLLFCSIFVPRPEWLSRLGLRGVRNPSSAIARRAQQPCLCPSRRPVPRPFWSDRRCSRLRDPTDCPRITRQQLHRGPSTQYGFHLAPVKKLNRKNLLGNKAFAAKRTLLFDFGITRFRCAIGAFAARPRAEDRGCNYKRRNGCRLRYNRAEEAYSLFRGHFTRSAFVRGSG